MVIYQLVMVLALPGLLLAALIRGGWRERLGFRAAAAGTGRAAPVGAWRFEWRTDLRALVLEAVLAARPGLQVLATANSATGGGQWWRAGGCPAWWRPLRRWTPRAPRARRSTCGSRRRWW